jgi:hypothetical protein
MYFKNLAAAFMGISLMLATSAKAAPSMPESYEWFRGSPYLKRMMVPPPFVDLSSAPATGDTKPEQDAMLTIIMCVLIPAYAMASPDAPTPTLASLKQALWLLTL